MTPTNAGGAAGATRKVETTPRWSDGHGPTSTSTSGPPGSPTIRLAVVRTGPMCSTQSIRSNTSCGSSSGPPGVQVKPGTAIGSGWISRYESTNPTRRSASLTGHLTG